MKTCTQPLKIHSSDAVCTSLKILNATASLASGGDEETVCFYLKVLHSCQACTQCGRGALPPHACARACITSSLENPISS